MVFGHRYKKEIEEKEGKPKEIFPLQSEKHLREKALNIPYIP